MDGFKLAVSDSAVNPTTSKAKSTLIRVDFMFFNHEYHIPVNVYPLIVSVLLIQICFFKSYIVDSRPSLYSKSIINGKKHTLKGLLHVDMGLDK
jgi:hypothetical protein